MPLPLASGNRQYAGLVDAHVERVTRALRAAWTHFQAGRASLLDLSRLSEQAATAIDNATAPLPQLLARAAGDLEYAYFAHEQEEHAPEAHRILEPVLALLDER